MKNIERDAEMHELGIHIRLLIHEFEVSTGMKVLDFYGQWLDTGRPFPGHEVEVTVEDDSAEILTGGTYGRDKMTVELRKGVDK